MQSLYIYLLIYILVVVAISYLVSRRQTKEDFLIAGRNRSKWQILFSKFATSVGAGYFITYTGFAYEYGFGVFGLALGLLLGYILFGYWAAPRINAESKEKSFYKIGDFVKDKTKSLFSAKTVNFISNLMIFAWLLVGIIGGAKIINDFGLMSYTGAVVMTSLVVLAYLLLAGFKAVLITDVIQSFVIIALLVLVTLGIAGGAGVEIFSNVHSGGFDFATAGGFFLFGILSVFAYSSMYQLCYAAKNKNKAKHGISLAIIPVTLVAIMLFIIGTFMKINMPGLDSGLVFTEALKNFLPEALLPVAIVLFFAGIMSSADTSVYSIASHYSIGRKGNPVKNIRITTILLGLATMAIALIFRDIVDISVLAGGISLVIALPMVYLIAGGKSKKKFLASTFLAIIAGLLAIFFMGLEPYIAIPVIGASALGLLWKK